MTPLFSYFLQGSLVTAIFLLFYKLLLRRDTFFKWSRWYFVTAVLTSFLLPMVDISTLFTSTTTAVPVIEYLPDLSFSTLTITDNPWQTFITSLLYAGIVVMAIRLLMQMAALVQLRKNKRILKNRQVKIIELDEQVNPFSFFNEIYVNPCLHSDAELEEIIRHEQFHIEQKHTLDILLGEFLTIVFWFNPLAWLLKNELKQNLEFLTDKLVLETGIDARHYQYNLLKVSSLQNNIAAANHFHFLKLKNRIIMMNKQQTQPYHAIKFLLLVPVVALLLMAFSKRNHLIAALQSPIVQDTVPPPPPSATTPTAPSNPKTADIRQMDVTNKDGIKKVTITLKNGKKEAFDLNKPEDKKRFEEKYGKIEDAPEPPAAPTPSVNVISPVATVDVAVTPNPPATVNIANAPDVEISVTGYITQERKEVPINEKGYYLSIADDDGECVVIVKDKNKKIVEALKLTDWDAQKTKYENKYGKIPPAPKPMKATAVAPNTDASKNGPGNPYNVAGITFQSTQPTSSTNFTSQYTNALIIVDGVKQSKGFFNLNSIDPNTIESISILKDKAATDTYGEEGKEGVIIIKTKKKEPTTTITGTITDPRPKPNTTTPDPLYVVDGKIRTKDELKNIEPASIESVNVLKAEQAIAEYGEKGKNGVVKIILKK
jgi:TonB-dependent SusC/RagA subfamily outer membrane receptor